MFFFFFFLVSAYLFFAFGQFPDSRNGCFLTVLSSFIVAFGEEDLPSSSPAIPEALLQ